MAEDNIVVQIDPYSPAEMATRAEKIGANKAKLTSSNTFVLGLLAGSFIGVGALLPPSLAPTRGWAME